MASAISRIISRLDYLQDLGIDAIWLSPHFPSPLCDCGYDVADYRGVAPEYGTLKDFELFLNEAHKREIRLVLDLVLNHTSDQHPWFIESRASRDNPRRDWYIWRKGQPDGPAPHCLALQHAGQPRFAAGLQPLRGWRAQPGHRPDQPGPVADPEGHSLPVQRRRDRHARLPDRRPGLVP